MTMDRDEREAFFSFYNIHYLLSLSSFLSHFLFVPDFLYIYISFSLSLFSLSFSILLIISLYFLFSLVSPQPSSPLHHKIFDYPNKPNTIIQVPKAPLFSVQISIRTMTMVITNDNAHKQ